MKQPSKERGCDGKIRLGLRFKSYRKQADGLARKYGKPQGVYKCPHCENTHVTTKVLASAKYPPLLYIAYPG